MSEACEECLEWVIAHIKEKYCTYPDSRLMRSLVSTTDIIDKIETLAMERLINDLEYYKHLKGRRGCQVMKPT